MVFSYKKRLEQHLHNRHAVKQHQYPAVIHAVGQKNLICPQRAGKRRNEHIAGAAWGTVTGYLIGGVLPLFYFAKPRTVLYFVRPKWNGSILLNATLNGSSEMVNSLATAVTTFLFNISMMRLAGEDGIAAITIILYAPPQCPYHKAR